MDIVADLHLHSPYSRAVSQKINISTMYMWAKKKGIHLLSTADFTHPLWFRELRQNLVEAGDGVYVPRNKQNLDNEYFGGNESYFPRFILTVEVACIYTDKGKVRKIHALIFAPTFAVAEQLNRKLAEQGFNVRADGRPILGIHVKNLYELLLHIDDRIILVPCHIWTPWFSLYGSRSGYDFLEDCFGPLSSKIWAVETGLSSDPSMNWRIEDLESRSIVSFSDAHSLQNMGREATVIKGKSSPFGVTQGKKFKVQSLGYSDIIAAFKNDPKSNFEIAYTVEFYPEEGKYHYTGHRACHVSYSPDEEKRRGTICPVCKRDLTVGVMSRVEELAKKTEDIMPVTDNHGIVWITDASKKRPPYVSLVPLLEIIRESMGTKSNSKKVVELYERLIANVADEFTILLKTPLPDIAKVAGEQIASSVQRVRQRNLSIEAGFDGEYGKVSILSDSRAKDLMQMGLGF